ncbi:MAG TPA: nucleotidyltransferase family protein [Nitrososphaeria archaeon]|nr:MAG: nucleotidyltransferase [Nitrososphaerota archaeon]HDD42345.1 nucleotidyltransferase family protein [Nitrososphaeria archaeon]
MKAVILAGGYGKRLRPLTETLPKSLLPVGDKGIIEWQLIWLKKHGIEEVVVCAGYLKEKLMERLGSGSSYGLKIDYAIEEKPLGTGGALKNAERFLKGEENFIMLNGDVLTDLNPLDLLEDLDEGCIGSMALVPLPSPFGIVDFDPESRKIRSFVEKPRIREYWINAGVYALRSEIFGYLPEKGDIERTTFPMLAERGLLKAHPFESCSWMSIDSHKDLEEASRTVPKLDLFKG